MPSNEKNDKPGIPDYVLKYFRAVYPRGAGTPDVRDNALICVRTDPVKKSCPQYPAQVKASPPVNSAEGFGQGGSTTADSSTWVNGGANAGSNANPDIPIPSSISHDKILHREDIFEAPANTSEASTSAQLNTVPLPASFPCRICRREIPISLYHPKYIRHFQCTKYLENSYQVTALNTRMKCKNCAGDYFQDYRCRGPCLTWKPAHEFPKDQRVLGTYWCKNCIANSHLPTDAAGIEASRKFACGFKDQNDFASVQSYNLAVPDMPLAEMWHQGGDTAMTFSEHLEVIDEQDASGHPRKSGMTRATLDFNRLAAIADHANVNDQFSTETIASALTHRQVILVKQGNNVNLLEMSTQGSNVDQVLAENGASKHRILSLSPEQLRFVGSNRVSRSKLLRYILETSPLADEPDMYPLGLISSDGEMPTLLLIPEEVLIDSLSLAETVVGQPIDEKHNEAQYPHRKNGFESLDAQPTPNHLPQVHQQTLDSHTKPLVEARSSRRKSISFQPSAHASATDSGRKRPCANPSTPLKSSSRLTSPHDPAYTTDLEAQVRHYARCADQYRHMAHSWQEAFYLLFALLTCLVLAYWCAVATVLVMQPPGDAHGEKGL